MPMLPPPVPLPKEISIPLVAVASEIRALAPWTYLPDIALIGIRNPRTNDLRLASILGELRQVFAVQIFRGPDGVRCVQDIIQDDREPSGDMMEDLDMIKVEWCERKELDASDKLILTQSGFKPARNEPVQWPLFRSCEPGYVPVWISVKEAALLREELETLLPVLRLFKGDADYLASHVEGEYPILPLGSRITNADELEWLPVIAAPRPPEDPAELPEADLTRLKSLPLIKNAILEFGAPLMPEAAFVPDRGTRPVVPRLPIFVHAETGFSSAGKLVPAQAALGKVVAATVKKCFSSSGIRPERIQVQTDRLFKILRPLAEELGISLEVRPELRALEEAVADLADYMGSMQPP